MRALAIDTSTDTAGVALWDGQSCVARTSSDAAPAALARTPAPGETALLEASPLASPPGQHGERLLGLVDALFTRAGWSKRDLELVACSIGPGSFTGVRVGVATAKGIALALDLPIVGIGSLDAMAHAYAARRDGDVDPQRAIVALLDARKGEVFWSAHADDGALLAGPGHLAAARIGDLHRLATRPRVVFVGEVARRLPLAPADIVTSPETDRPDPAIIARLAAAKFARAGSDDIDALEPAYVRPPDITLPSASS